MRPLTGQDQIAFHAPDGAGGPHGRLAGLVSALGLGLPATLPGLTLAEWEELLLDLQIALRGPRIDAELTCPDCGAGNALIFSACDLPREPVAPLTLDGAALTLRLRDLMMIEARGLEGERGLAALLAAAAAIPEEEAAARLSGPDRDSVAEALERAASGLGLEITTACTECGTEIVLPFDIAGYVDADLRNRAALLLDEVHLMATRYHWSEAEILSLPDARRQDYLRRILAAEALSGTASLAEGA